MVSNPSSNHVNQTLECSLVTIGRFKFMDSNAVLIKL